MSEERTAVASPADPVAGGDAPAAAVSRWALRGGDGRVAYFPDVAAVVTALRGHEGRCLIRPPGTSRFLTAPEIEQLPAEVRFAWARQARWFVGALVRYGLAPFAWYRLVVAGVLGLLAWSGMVSW